MENKLKTVKIILVFSVLAILSNTDNAFSQDTNAIYFRHELSLGGGYIYGFEKDIFNIPDDNGINSAFGFNLNYCYALNKKMGVGVRLFGYFKSLPGYRVVNSYGTTENVDFVMKMFNYNGEFRYTFNRGSFEPYCFISAGAALGVISGNEKKLKTSGFNIGAGTGIKINLGERDKLSLELIGTFGSAVWESMPFINSTSDKYIPSMLCVLITISQLFGQVKE